MRRHSTSRTKARCRTEIAFRPSPTYLQSVQLLGGECTPHTDGLPHGIPTHSPSYPWGIPSHPLPAWLSYEKNSKPASASVTPPHRASRGQLRNRTHDPSPPEERHLPVNPSPNVPIIERYVDRDSSPHDGRSSRLLAMFPSIAAPYPRCALPILRPGRSVTSSFSLGD